MSAPAHGSAAAPADTPAPAMEPPLSEAELSELTKFVHLWEKVMPQARLALRGIAELQARRAASGSLPGVILSELKELRDCIYNWSGSAVVANEKRGAEFRAEQLGRLYGDLCSMGATVTWLIDNLERAPSPPAAEPDTEAYGTSLTEAVVKRDGYHLNVSWFRKGVPQVARVYDAHQMPLSSALADVLVMALEHGTAPQPGGAEANPYDITGALMCDPEAYKELDHHMQVRLHRDLADILGLAHSTGGAEAKEPDMFWDASDPEVGDELANVLSDYPEGEAVRVFTAYRGPDMWAINMPDCDMEVGVTRAEVEAKYAAAAPPPPAAGGRGDEEANSSVQIVGRMSNAAPARTRDGGKDA